MRPASIFSKLFAGFLGVTLASVACFSLFFSAEHGRASSGVQLLTLFAIAICFSALAARLIGARFVRQISVLRTATEAFVGARRPSWPAVGDPSELHELSETLRRTFESINQQIVELHRQDREQQAVLSSMVEGVIAIDTEERILTINQAAARLFDVDRNLATGRSVQEIVRNYDFLSFVVDVLRRDDELESEILLRDDESTVLNAHGSPLRDERGRRIGALIVLHDITKLRKLEGLRREFVANVSHELRTPITSIQGFVEALLDGALADPQLSPKFLGIIARQVQGLNAIIDDLLSLSTIEQQSDSGNIQLVIVDIQDILAAVHEVCLLKASAKQIRIEVVCDARLQSAVNPTLLEQAIVNLVDNAIKYSDEGTVVLLKAEKVDEELCISVTDRGWGIPSDELPRVFERFYRVDKARSRKLGGTGLGLAITKHVALAHNGVAYAESEVGRGSKFTIRVPLRQSEEGALQSVKTLGA